MVTTFHFSPKTVNGLLFQALVDINKSSSKYLNRSSGVLSNLTENVVGTVAIVDVAG